MEDNTSVKIMYEDLREQASAQFKEDELLMLDKAFELHAHADRLHRGVKQPHHQLGHGDCVKRLPQIHGTKPFLRGGCKCNFTTLGRIGYLTLLCQRVRCGVPQIGGTFGADGRAHAKQFFDQLRIRL